MIVKLWRAASDKNQPLAEKEGRRRAARIGNAAVFLIEADVFT